MSYYLGLDAGGTKTFCLVADASCRVTGFGRAGTGSYEYHGVEPAAIENQKAVQAALDDAGISLDDVAGIGMGVAGADVPEDYAMLERDIYTPLFGSRPRVFRNDSFAALRGGLREPYGIVIACGTGCVCAGANRKGEETRVGGLGEPFGDMTSGSSIGREGIEAIWRVRDNIYEPTALTERFLRRSGKATIDELFYALYREEITYADLEPMAEVVCEAAYEGDALACDLLERHGRYLGQMVNGAARRLNMTREPFTVVTAGSVFKSRSPVLVDAMRTVIHRVCPEASTAMPLFEPVVGALLLGIEQDHAIGDDEYDRLVASLAGITARHGVTFRAETT